MKNYCEIRGIKKADRKYTLPSGTEVRLLSHPYRSANIMVVDAEVLATGKTGKIGKVKLDSAEEQKVMDIISAAAKIDEAALQARYPGLDELLTIIHGHNEAQADFARSMEDESRAGLAVMSAPEVSIEQARANYPLAAAYLVLLSLANANPASQIGYIRRQAGEQALTAIEESNIDVLVALDTAQKYIKETKGD